MAKDFGGDPLKTAQKPHLKPSQARAVTVLLESPSIVAAARKAKVGESTLRCWLREDEHFQMTLRRLREEALTHASLRLQAKCLPSGRTHDRAHQFEGPHRTGRASIARTLLDFAFRAGAYSDLADRIRAIEQAAANEKK